ncbi:MAG: hypothetical protein ACRDV7_12895, partial [Acidimicrobiia bacterium]
MTPNDLVFPEIAKAIEIIPFDHVDAEILPALRGAFPMGLPLSDAVERTDHVVAGEPDVPLRLHRPKDADGALPCVYSMHGGGYVLGTYLMDDMTFDALCPRLGFVGVSVEY